MGGPIKGGKLYGYFPSLIVSGDDDRGRRGRWIPSTSVDQYSAVLAKWFGVDDIGLNTIFPNLCHFSNSPSNLDFITASQPSLTPCTPVTT